jgi:hypothetical protein
LCPALFETERPYPLAELDAQSMIAAGHAAMIDVSCILCVWYARHGPMRWALHGTALTQAGTEGRVLCLSSPEH